MGNKSKPVITAYYDPALRDWDAAIRKELERRGIDIKDIGRYCIFAVPKHAASEYYKPLKPAVGGRIA